MIQKTAKSTDDLSQITKVTKELRHNNSETVSNEKERYISQEERQKIIDDLRFI